MWFFCALFNLGVEIFSFTYICLKKGCLRYQKVVKFIIGSCEASFVSAKEQTGMRPWKVIIKSLVIQRSFPKNSLHAVCGKRKAIISSDLSCVNLSQRFVIRSQNFLLLYCAVIVRAVSYLNYATAVWFYRLWCIHLIIKWIIKWVFLCEFIKWSISEHYCKLYVFMPVL